MVRHLLNTQCPYANTLKFSAQAGIFGSLFGKPQSYADKARAYREEQNAHADAWNYRQQQQKERDAQLKIIEGQKWKNHEHEFEDISEDSQHGKNIRRALSEHNSKSVWWGAHGYTTVARVENVFAIKRRPLSNTGTGVTEQFMIVGDTLLTECVDSDSPEKIASCEANRDAVTRGESRQRCRLFFNYTPYHNGGSRVTAPRDTTWDYKVTEFWNSCHFLDRGEQGEPILQAPAGGLVGGSVP